MVVIAVVWTLMAVWGHFLGSTVSSSSTVQPPSSQSATEWPDGLNPFVPSIGDVKLEDNGLVMLYFSDGVRPPGWGTICGKACGQASAETVCRQLGYQEGFMINNNLCETNADLLRSHTHSATPLSSSGSNTLWLDSLHCDSIHTHILQCNYTVSESNRNRSSCNNFLHVECNSNLTPYDGAVRLCRPSSTVFVDTQNASVSMGLVQLYYISAGGGQWAGINQQDARHPLGSLDADSICRQLGYTNAVASSTITQGTLTSSLSKVNVSFDNCYKRANEQAWLKTDNLQCNSSQVCFGCCFLSSPSLCSGCNTTMDIVIRCTFDRTIYNDKKDSPKNCNINSEHKLHPSSCSQPADSIPLKTFEIAIGSVGSLALLLFLALCGVFIGLCSYRYRQRRLQQGGGRHHRLDEHDNEN